MSRGMQSTSSMKTDTDPSRAGMQFGSWTSPCTARFPVREPACSLVGRMRALGPAR